MQRLSQEVGARGCRKGSQGVDVDQPSSVQRPITTLTQLSAGTETGDNQQALALPRIYLSEIDVRSTHGSAVALSRQTHQGGYASKYVCKHT